MSVLCLVNYEFKNVKAIEEPFINKCEPRFKY